MQRKECQTPTREKQNDNNFFCSCIMFIGNFLQAWHPISDVVNLADKNWLIARTKLLKARWTSWYAVQCSKEGLDPFIEETKQPLYKCMVQHGGVISTGKDSPAFIKHWSLFPGNHFGLGRHVPRHVNPPLTRSLMVWGKVSQWFQW